MRPLHNIPEYLGTQLDEILEDAWEDGPDQFAIPWIECIVDDNDRRYAERQMQPTPFHEDYSRRRRLEEIEAENRERWSLMDIHDADVERKSLGIPIKQNPIDFCLEEEERYRIRRRKEVHALCKMRTGIEGCHHCKSPYVERLEYPAPYFVCRDCDEKWVHEGDDLTEPVGATCRVCGTEAPSIGPGIYETIGWRHSLETGSICISCRVKGKR